MNRKVRAFAADPKNVDLNRVNIGTPFHLIYPESEITFESPSLIEILEAELHQEDFQESPKSLMPSGNLEDETNSQESDQDEVYETQLSMISKLRDYGEEIETHEELQQDSTRFFCKLAANQAHLRVTDINEEQRKCLEGQGQGAIVAIKIRRRNKDISNKSETWTKKRRIGVIKLVKDASKRTKYSIAEDDDLWSGSENEDFIPPKGISNDLTELLEKSLEIPLGSIGYDENEVSQSYMTLHYPIKDTETSSDRPQKSTANNSPEIRNKRISKDKLPRKRTVKRKRRRPAKATCTICNKTICNNYNLLLHMRTHSGEKPCKCPFCDKRFYKPQNLRTHLVKHTNEKPYACEFCGSKFAYNHVLKSHKASQHKAFDTDEVISECEYCLKKYASQGELNKHFRRHHYVQGEGEGAPRFRNFSCSYCEIRLESVDLMREHGGTGEHLKKVHEVEEAAQIKTTSGKKSAKKNNLKKDLITHVDKKPFACKENDCCGQQFNTQASLSIQKTDEATFNCEYCTKEFNKVNKTYRKHLCVTHKNLHLRDKPEVCLGCYKNFKCEEELNEHLKVHSNGDTSGKVFDRNYKLIKHRRTHETKMPLKSEECVTNSTEDETASKSRIQFNVPWKETF